MMDAAAPTTDHTPGAASSLSSSMLAADASGDAPPRHSLQTLVFKSVKRSHDLFLSDYGTPVEIPIEHASVRLRLESKFQDEYSHLSQQAASITAATAAASSQPVLASAQKDATLALTSGPSSAAATSANQRALVVASGGVGGASPAFLHAGSSSSSPAADGIPATRALALLATAPRMPKPDWHAPWKLMRVISGHTGWVKCIAVDPTNEWFATGAADRIIKIWDLASGTLKLSLTGHISTVRGLSISSRHPYLFSASEDKSIKCWDLEANKVVRHYHGHTSSIYCLSLHPVLDVLVSGGRDATARVWDMRTKACVHVLTGHKSQIDAVQTQAADPQVITGSADSTIRLWDLAAGKTRTVLTNHKKSVRSLAIHPTEFSFVSGAADNIKQWRFPDGMFLQNFDGHHAVVNSVSVNADGVLMSGGDNGTLFCWDYKSGHNFQQIQSPVQPGSLESEAGIFASTFDMSGSRFFTCDADKSIKVYKEDETATEQSHPLNWKPGMLKRRY